MIRINLIGDFRVAFHEVKISFRAVGQTQVMWQKLEKQPKQGEWEVTNFVFFQKALGS